MIDSTVLTIIPPLIASVFAYIIANKRAKLQYANTVTNIQTRALEIVSSSEEKMRMEIRSDLLAVREENTKYRAELSDLRIKLDDATKLLSKLSSLAYKRISLVMIMITMLIILLINGPLGFMFSIICTIVGLYAVNKNVQKVSMLSSLMVPTILLLLGVLG